MAAMMLAVGAAASNSSLSPLARPIYNTYGITWQYVEYEIDGNSLYIDLIYLSDPAWGVHLPILVPIAKFEGGDQYYFGEYPEGEVVTAIFKPEWRPLIVLELYGLDGEGTLWLLQTLTAQDILENEKGIPRLR